ncbi:hypothetical protein JCGZ_25239 [Jatropha curcas]|uniref:Uncharacterized protein n=1 Tax=Jatropha curcas TaxID=180498 RepID=A0A067L725_JATCU|nr:hypothetical protein JCGZ_25239 [Jatropha curcas]
MAMELLMACVPFLLSLALIQAVILISKGSKKASSGKLPPGPTPLPILGNLLELGDKPHKSLAKLAKIHGPLMSLQLGQITIVVISSSSLAKQVLQTFDLSFCNRPVVEAIRARGHHKVSVAWAPDGSGYKAETILFETI